MFSKFFPLKSCRSWDNVEKYGEAREAINNNTVWRTCIACWIRKATHARTCTFPRAWPFSYTHTQKYCFSIATIVIANTPHCYVTRTLHAISHMWFFAVSRREKISTTPLRMPEMPHSFVLFGRINKIIAFTAHSYVYFGFCTACFVT